MAAKIKISTNKQVLAARFLHADMTDSASGDVNLKTFVKESTQQQKLVAAVSGNTYVGDEVDKSSGCKYYIAKFNRRKSKLRVYSARVFSMGHYDEDFLQHEKEELEKDAAMRLLQLSNRDSVNKLTESFGASWKKRTVRERIQQEERSSQNQAGVTKTSDYILENEGDLEAKLAAVKSEMESTKFGPPCNKEAESLEEAYPLNGILSAVEMEALEEAVDELLDCTPDQMETWHQKGRYPSYVLAQLQLLPMDTKMRRHKCCLLLYVSYLIHLHQMKASQLSRKDPLPHKWPQLIRKKLLSQFAHLTMGTSRQKFNWRLSPSQKDNLVAHIIVLALHINNFLLPIRHIAADLKLMGVKFLNRAQALGCCATKKKATEKNGWTEDEKYVQLKLPLKFPTGHSMGSRRKK